MLNIAFARDFNISNAKLYASDSKDISESAPADTIDLETYLDCISSGSVMQLFLREHYRHLVVAGYGDFSPSASKVHSSHFS
mmetsp:Transcript_9650/g.5056  ORF Transcript_9650/g.5056 Transcript_9650/m.5056 type:complete len:82 (-) Transcript_9650:191-436(-)